MSLKIIQARNDHKRGFSQIITALQISGTRNFLPTLETRNVLIDQSIALSVKLHGTSMPAAYGVWQASTIF
jgi:hypothetical protein